MSPRAPNSRKRSPTRGESPLLGQGPLCEPQLVKVLQSGEEGRLLNATGAPPRQDLHPSVLGPAFELAVERGDSFLRHLPGLGAPDVEVATGAALLGGELLGTPTKAVGDVSAIEADVAAVTVDAADDDMGVGMIRVVVVDRVPLELATEISRDAGHQSPHVVGEIELDGVFGEDNEAEPVLLAQARLLEGSARADPSAL